MTSFYFKLVQTVFATTPQSSALNCWLWVRLTATWGLRTPLAVRIGLAFSLGTKARRYCGGTAAMMSTNRGWASSPYFADVFVFTLHNRQESSVAHFNAQGSKQVDLLVEIDVFAVFMGLNQLLDDIGNGHHHQLCSAEITWQKAIINRATSMCLEYCHVYV